MANSSNDESCDEEEHDDVCNITWIELKKKSRDWVQGNISDEYICPNYYGKRNISADDDLFFGLFASDHKYYVRFSFNCPPGHLIIQWSYQLLMNHS